jgi:YidC/Oxa1 family membrane protein insertase
MALYKTKGVNPASGCLPMLLTFPLLYAFYALLGSSIELRGAPFIFWIHDLSLKDPFYVLPIVMAISMFWQQRMMPPAGGDPLQQKMFMFMPLIFLFTFLWSPSGLAVYWFTSNIMAIGQQYVTNRMIASGTVK